MEALALNIADSASVDRCFEQIVAAHGRLDILVNNAGVGQNVAAVSALSDQEWQRVINVTLTGTFYCCRAAARIMERQESGTIVNIASINGQNPAALVAAYNVAKAGVISLTRSLALELAAYSVRVNAVSPGPVYTEFNKTVMSQRCRSLDLPEEQMIERVRSSIPLGRWGQAEDIASAVAFLCSPEASLDHRRGAPRERRTGRRCGRAGQACPIMTANSDMPVIGICGAGQMGAAMAACFRRNGYRALVWLRDEQKLAATRETVSGLESWLSAHLGPPATDQGSVELLTDLSKIDAAAEVIVDCIAENMEQKAGLFRNLAAARRRGSLFLTTTSGLSITQLGRLSGTGSSLVGTHFWNPPHLMPLVEVIRGDDTDQRAMDRAVAVIQSIGKIPVRVNREVPGFIGNRLLHAMWREAIFLVQSGVASAEDVDRVARLTFGLRLAAVGPLENMDLVGLDLVETIHDYLLSSLADQHEPLPLLRSHVERGELGMKSGQGFYDWRRRRAQELIERRDRQIVDQLRLLEESGAL